MATETERLEREAEATRAELEQTLGELRARMSPGSCSTRRPAISATAAGARIFIICATR